MYEWVVLTPRYNCNEVYDVEDEDEEEPPELPQSSNTEFLVPESQEENGFDESLRFPGWDFDGGLWPEEASEPLDMSNLA